LGPFATNALTGSITSAKSVHSALIIFWYSGSHYLIIFTFVGFTNSNKLSASHAILNVWQYDVGLDVAAMPCGQ
jgi:hypothetical protein